MKILTLLSLTLGFGLALCFGPTPCSAQTLDYATFLGGSLLDSANGMAVGPDGSVVVVGVTASSDFPLANPFDGTLSADDAFVARISADGSELIYSTYLGSGAPTLSGPAEYGTDVFVDANNNAYVVGLTDSPVFPTTPGAAFEGIAGGFLTKFSPTGEVIYSTVIPYGNAWAIAVDAAGAAYVGGGAFTEFSTTPGSYSPGFGGGTTDAYIAKFSPDGTTLEWATFLGGSDIETVAGLDLDSSGNVFVAGHTRSTNFPTTVGAHDSSLGGSQDGFVAKLSPDGAQLLACTLVGGAAGTDAARFLRVDSAGRPVIGGWTAAADFPATPGTYGPVFFGGVSDGVIARFDSSLEALQVATFIGGGDMDVFEEIELDSADNIYATGRARSADFPTTADAFQLTFGGGSIVGDGVLVILSPEGTELILSTYLGRSELETADAVAVSPDGSAIYVAGETRSADFPVTPGALQGTFGGSGFSGDAYVARFSGPVITALENFRRGDANGDGVIDIADAVAELSSLFVAGTPAPECDDAADVNDDGAIDISDPVFALSSLFVPGAPPVPAPASCAGDPTGDGLDCASYSACP